MPNCPTDEPLTVTQPTFIRGVTLSTRNGRVNVHLNDELGTVYRAETLDPAIHRNIALLASLAYVNNRKVTVTWEGGQDIGEPYCLRNMVRITLEGDRDLIPWGHREDPCQ